MPIFLTLLTNRILTIVFCLAAAVFTAQAATLTVTKTADTNDNLCNADCSLREAIYAAAPDDTIVFASPLFDSPQTITLLGETGFGSLLIDKNLTITGKGANLLTVRRPSSAALFRIFEIAGARVNLSGMTITGGSVNGRGGGISAFNSTLTITGCHITGNTSSAGGAGISNLSEIEDAGLHVVNSTISNNTSHDAGFDGAGGGIDNYYCVMTITNSTISGNVRTGGESGAGGIFAVSPNVSTITNSTITDNGAVGAGSAGGIRIQSGAVNFRNTIVAANRNNAAMPDVVAAMGNTFDEVTSQGYNIIGNPGILTRFNQTGDQTGASSGALNPLLEPLGSYGGDTPTHRLQPNSPAIDKGNSSSLTTDQRGSVRPVENLTIANAPGGDGSDIGAFETSATLIVTNPADTQVGACDSDCTLREAITAAGTGNTIEFSSLFNAPQIITLSDAAGLQGLIINKNLTINGKGANLLTVRRNPASSVNFRIFTISGANVILNGMTVTGGRTFGANARSGGIHSESNASVTINGCHITDNEITSVSAVKGGGISALTGTLVINDSTVSNNRVISGSTTNSGGGIFTSLDTRTTITNSTISGNIVTNASGSTSDRNGGGIFNGGAMTVRNSTITDNGAVGANSASGIFNNSNLTVGSAIIAGNRNNSVTPDAAQEGTFVSQGFNLVGNAGTVSAFNQPSDQVGNSSAPINPLLAALALNGGSTPTHALMAGSPAIDAGDDFGNFTDQRGAARPVDNPGAPAAPGGDNSDVGSFEAERFPALVVTKIEDTNDGACDEQDCSLREAIAAAPARGGEIIFSSLFDAPQTITLSDAAGFRELLISDKSLSIQGKGAQLLTVRRDTSSSVNFPVFAIRRIAAANPGVTLGGMKITGGVSSNGGGGIDVSGYSLTVSSCHITGNGNLIGSDDAGGIALRNSPSLTVLNSTISNNTVLSSGAVNSAGGIKFVGGQFIMTNSTVSGNSVGGGSSNSGGLQLSVVSGIVSNSTITDNQANGTNTAGGVIGGSNATARNTIIAGNRNNTSVPDLRGAFTSGGFNLVGSTTGNNFADGINNDRVGTFSSPLNPLLDALGSYGGTTPTHRLQTDSPAIDKGYGFDSGSDQRGAARPVDNPSVPNSAAGDAADIGAFETQIAASNQPPVANPDSYTASRNTPLVVASPGVLVNDADVDSVSLTAIKVSDPSHGSLTLNPNGGFTYTPATNFIGVDSFTYRAYDGAAYSDVVAVTITVNPGGAAMLTVTKTADTQDGACDTDCSLREAITAAVSGDTIVFSTLFDSPQTITLAAGGNNSGTLVINKNLTIVGKRANLLTIRGNSNDFQIFVVTGNNVVAGISNLTVTSGNAGSSYGGGININESAALTVSNCNITNNVAAAGGGIFIDEYSTLNLIGSTVSGNTGTANFGSSGGIHNEGILNVNNSTISGNIKNNDNNNGGGIWTIGATTINSSTITDNRAAGSGSASGIFRFGNFGTVSLGNTIIAANRSNSTIPDLVGAFTSNGYNLVGNVGAATGFPQTGDQTGASSSILNPGLAPLDFYGGGTQTHALFANSPAVNAANLNNSPNTDQRGMTRSNGGRADIGAFELNLNFLNSPTGANGQGTLPGAAVQQSYSVQFSVNRLNSFSEQYGDERFSESKPEDGDLMSVGIFSIIAGNLPAGLSLNPSGVLSGTPMQAGTFAFTIKFTDFDGMAGAQQYVLNVFGPTAAGVSIGGRVLTPEGEGLKNARVNLTDSQGNSRSALTNAFGYYRFAEVPAGEIYIIQVISKRYQFEPRSVTVMDEITDLNFSPAQ
jgi:CSLREA domain-containing protein